jgi:hypothetical protein
MTGCYSNIGRRGIASRRTPIFAVEILHRMLCPYHAIEHNHAILCKMQQWPTTQQVIIDAPSD